LDSLTDAAIRKALPQIFKRPYLSVPPETQLMYLAPFLAIGPQIYVDGLVVTKGDRPVGRVGGKQILLTVLDSNYPQWLQINASQIMDDSGISTEMDSPLGQALKIFRQTGFAFVPVTNKGMMVASLAIRDVLSVLAKTDMRQPLKPLSSPLVQVSKKTDLKNALRIMFERKIRNLIVRDGSNNYVINDRKILEFLFSHDGREIMRRGIAGISAVEVELIDMIPAVEIREDTSFRNAAELLMDVGNPCLLLGSSIVTPWDLVMKTIGKDVPAPA
jgi:CBS domain-containing protein